MASFLENMSLMPKGLRYKIIIAFSLMALIPLLVCVWIVTSYIFPNINLLQGLSIGNISLILVISLVISLLGFYVGREMINPIIKIAEDAKLIAEGDLERVIELKREDEIGDISASLNVMTQKIRENMEELKMYGEKTKEINIEINKKVLTLSGLLETGNLISASTDILTVIDFIVQKLSEIEEKMSCFIMLLDGESKEFHITTSYNINEDKLRNLAVTQDEALSYIVVVDKNNPSKDKLADKLLSTLDFKNIIVLPIIAYRNIYGILVIGNKEKDFVFEPDERELVNVFARQTCLAVENDLLVKKTKQLSIKDELTGLYNRTYIRARLDEEIKRAILYQRPCGYLLVDVDNFEKLYGYMGGEMTVSFLKATAEILKGAVTEIDKVARLEKDRFAVLLPEKNKKQSSAIAEEIKKRVEDRLYKVVGLSQKVTVSIGVSENPIDGSNADELMEKAERLLKNAKSLGKNRVAV